MDVSNTQHEPAEELDVAGEEPTPVASDDFMSPRAGDDIAQQDYLQRDSIHVMEPSLELAYPSGSLDEPLAEHSSFIPGDDIDFPSSRNSPDIAGASSVMLNRWDARDTEHHSPRSELSYHSSIYPVASVRTSITGSHEPRSLVRSSEGRTGLETGDVIMLKHQGRPYVAIQARLPYKDDAWHTCLELLAEDAAPESEGMAYLEVVKQGPYVGFRSGAAGNRFVQPRRKAPHRLVFFNQNCGVWEQWDVLGDNWRSTPWSSLPIVFRNRRLPQVQLAVDVVRVGFYTTPGGASFAPTPRSLLPAIPEEGHVEDTNLRRISNVLVVEWLKFVDHEKLLRQGLEASLEALQGEMEHLKVNTIRQVEYLRLQMIKEMAGLGDLVGARDALISMLRSWLRRTQQLAANQMARARHRRILMAWRYVVDDIVYHKAVILKLRRKHERELRDRAFWAWISRARGSAGAANKFIVTVQRRSHTIMSRVLLGWQRVLAHRAWRARVMVAAVQRRSAHCMAATFSAWRRVTAQRAAGRGALQRALHGVSLTWLAAALTAWRAATLAARRYDVQAELMAERYAMRLMATAFAGWHDVIRFNRAADRLARSAVLKHVLKAWRSSVSASQLRCNAAAAMAAERPMTLRRSVLDAWREMAASGASLRRLLNRHVVERSTGLQARVLAVWGQAARTRRRQEVLLHRHLSAVGLRRRAAVLTGWRTWVARMRWRRARMQTAVIRAATRRMSAVLCSWRSYAATRAASIGRGALLEHRVHHMRLRAILAAWRQLAARVRAARRGMEAFGGRLKTQFLSLVFREWRLLARTGTASRAAAARALPARTRDLLTRLLGMWWARHCAAPMGLEPASNPSSAAGRRRGTLSATASVSKTPRTSGQASGAQLDGFPAQLLQQLLQTSMQCGTASQVNSPRAQHPALAATAPPASWEAGATQLLPQQPGAAAGHGPFASPPAAAAAAAAAAVSGSQLFPGAVGNTSPVAGPAPASPASTTTFADSSSAQMPQHPGLVGATASIPTTGSQRPTGPSGHASPASAPASGSLTPVRTPRSYREALVTGAVAADGFAVSPPASSVAGDSAACSRSSSIGRMRTSASGTAGGSPARVRALGFAGSVETAIEAREVMDLQPEAVPTVMAVVSVPFDSFESAMSWPAVGSSSGLGRWLATAVLRHWRRAAAVRRGLEAVCERAVEAARRRHARAVLTALYDAALRTRGMVASAEAMAVRVATRNNRQIMREVLVSWHVAARRRVTVRALVARHAARAVIPVMRRTLVEWQAVAAARRAVTRKVAKLASRHRLAATARVFAAWRDDALDSAARRNAAAQLATSHTRDLLSSALYGWSGAAAERRARATRDVRAARHAHRRRLQCVFSRWRWAAQEATERAEAAVRVSRSTALRTAFGGWLRVASDDHHSGHVDRFTAMQRAAGWHARRVLRGCLAALYEHRERCQLLQRQMAAIRARVEAATQSAVLAHLQAAAAEARRADLEGLKMRARTAKRLLARILSSWLSYTEALQEARETAEGLGARVDRSLLASAWEGWQDAARSAVEARAQLAACSSRIARGCLKRAFLAWQGQVETRRALKTRMVAAANRVKGVLLSHVLSHWAAIATHHRIIRAAAAAHFSAHMRALLSRAFSAWHSFVRNLRAARRIAMTRGRAVQRTLLRSVLVQWAACVECRHARAALATAKGARRAEAVLLPAALRGWAAVAEAAKDKRRLQCVLVTRLMLRRCMAQQRRAFQAWREALAERRERDDELRRCIKRKKLAFAQFKQWYWEAFDADVQATIRRMFHSTDPAAHSPKPTIRTKFPFGAMSQSVPYFQQDPEKAVQVYGTGAGAASEWQPGGGSAGDSGNMVGSWRAHAVAAAYGGAGVSGGRPADVPPPEPSSDPFLRHAATTGGVGGADRPSQRSAANPSGALQADAIRHRLLQVQAQQRSSAAAVELQQQQQQQPAQTQRSGRVESALSEPVRTLAPAFDAMAQPIGGSAAVGGAVANRTRGGAAANPNAALRASASAASRPLPAKAAYRALLHSDSTSSDDAPEGDNDTSRNGAAALSGRGAASAVPFVAAGGALKMQSTASFRSWAPAGSNDAAAARRNSGSRGSASAVPPLRMSAAAGLPTQRGAAIYRPATTADAPAAAAPAPALAPVASAPPNLEAVTAWNAVLVNMTQQLTEVSRASLELAAGVVNSGAAAGSPERPTTRTPAATGSTSTTAYFLPHASIEAKSHASESSAQQRSHFSGTSPSGSPGGILPAGSLSPLSPSPQAPYNVYSHRSPSTGSLPGVVPSWRHVNGLYDGGYDDDLGPVNPFFAGIASAGAAAVGAGVGADADSSAPSGNGSSEGEMTLGEESGSQGSSVVGGSSGAAVPAVVQPDAGLFPVRFPVYQNAVFRQHSEDEEEEDGAYEETREEGDGEQGEEEYGGCGSSGVSSSGRY